MEIEQGNVGAVGTQSLELVGGKLVLKLQAGRGAFGGSLEIDVDGKALADLIVAKLPAEVQPFAKAIEGAILGV